MPASLATGSGAADDDAGCASCARGVLRLRDSTRVQGPSASRTGVLLRFAAGRGTGVDDSGAVADESLCASSGACAGLPAFFLLLLFFFLGFAAAADGSAAGCGSSSAPGTTAGNGTTVGSTSVCDADGAAASLAASFAAAFFFFLPLGSAGAAISPGSTARFDGDAHSGGGGRFSMKP